MVRDWQDPTTLLLSGRAFEFTVCICSGTYLWEFFTSLSFDWAIFTGKFKFRLSVVPYMIARYMLLLALMAGIRVVNVFEPINCVAWNHLVYLTAHICVAMGSVLLLLRVFAITEYNIYIVIFLGLFYFAECGMLLHTAIVVESMPFPAIYACGAVNTVASLGNMWVALSFDTACTVIMLVALLRTPGGGFWKFLVQQGFIYFVVTTVCYLVCVIFLMLNLNDAINELPQTVAVTILIICATRMYRDLAYYSKESTEYPDTSTRAGQLIGSWAFSTGLSTSTVKPSTIDFRKADRYNKDYDVEMAPVDDERGFKNHTNLRDTRSEGDVSVITEANIGEFDSRDGSYTVDNGINLPIVFPPGSRTGVLKTTPARNS
ncbi:hypothetical protein BKA62DRAFT_769793 [Auriculariales sp. MPI-PUGE-AT-0066]|nr:hypothetical protein BKA62DRAFT_769793 [Auriculariales sp. MPI-PUGE-AT-0066]